MNQLDGVQRQAAAPEPTEKVTASPPPRLRVTAPPATLRAAFSRYPAWRDALLVLVVGSMIAYVANDSGAAAAGWGFGLAVAGIFYVLLVEDSWRTDTERR